MSAKEEKKSTLKNRREEAQDVDSSKSEIIPPPPRKAARYSALFRRMASPHLHTILDSPEWRNSNFYGFYVLFWVAISTHVFRILVINYVGKGHLLQTQIINTLLKDCWHVALTDLFMYLCMYEAFFVQKLVAKGYINWARWGWVLQHIYQTGFLVFFVVYARVVDFPWIGRIFLALHALVQMMKMHSYTAFNGGLSALKRETKKKTVSSAVAEDVVDEAKIELGIYPSNLTLRDFFMFTMYPTAVYELDYPRSERIRWGYALRKILAVFGVFVCMIVIAQQSLLPVVVRANEIRSTSLVTDRMKQYPLIFLDVLPPFMIIYILTFYIIWDAILSSIAELTRYGDREFYRDWWNSSEWAKFARDWNVPVHNFLQRHVYTSSRLFLKLNKIQAMIYTFFFSAAVHELAMWVIFGRIRGYLMLMQLTQLPMQFISQTPFFKKRKTLGLVFFWLGMAIGPSCLCSLYLTI